MSRIPVLLAAACASVGLFAADPLPPEEAKLRFIDGLVEDFQNNQRNWRQLAAGEKGRSEISNGVFRFDHRGEGYAGAALPLPLAGNRPFEVSVDVRFASESGSGLCGLQWGGKNGLGSWNHFLVTREGSYVIARIENGQEVVFAKGNAALPADRATRLTIRNLGKSAVAFLNGRVVWTGNAPPAGNQLSGVLAYAPATAEFDNFSLRHLRADETTLAERLEAYTSALGKEGPLFTTLPAPAPVVVNEATEVSPEVVAQWEQQGFDLHQAGKFRESETAYRRVLQQQPENSRAYINLAWCLLNLGDFPAARSAADTAFALDQLGVLPRVVLAYAAGAEGKPSEAQAHYEYLASFDPEAANLEGLRKDLADLAKNGHARIADPLRPVLEAAYQSHRGRLSGLNSALVAAERALQTRDPAALREAAKSAAAAAEALPAEYRSLSPWVSQAMGSHLALLGDRASAIVYLEKAYSALRPLDEPHAAFGRANNAVQLALSLYEGSVHERALNILESEREAAMALPLYAGRLKGDLLQSLAASANALQRVDVLRARAPDLLAIAGTGRDDWYRAWGHYYLAASYSQSTLPNEVSLMKASYQRALALAEEKRHASIDDAARSGLAFVLWKQGDNAGAEQLYLAAASRAEARSDFVRGEALLNNLGAVMYSQKNYKGAVPVFRRAVSMTERAREKASPEERIGLLGARLSAYQFLVLALHHAGDQAALFEAIGASRARVLGETLGVESQPTDLATFQSALQADEAAVLYTVIGGGEYVAQVVTRDTARSLYQDGRVQLVPIKRRFMDRINVNRPGYKPAEPIREAGGAVYRVNDLATTVSRSDLEDAVELYRQAITASPDEVPRELRTEILGTMETAFGSAFLQPISSYIAGKKRLILMPDGIQYFLPFEALPLSGSRLIVSHDVRYIQSVDIWMRLRKRDYSQLSRTSFLGMGGALYAAMEETSPRVKDASRHVEVQIEAQRNAREGRSQREIYSALWGNKAMNFLAGSLYEVKALGAIFADSQIFLGADMSEPRMKAMSRDGSLARFRIVHLATHGFAVPEVPELSGIAMTLTPRAEGGEDGYLTAPEIARLGMKADLVVLSACETGLGRIYNGEGVAGLTGALLVGGGNRALVSLWPVSDAGTMQFMKDVYALVTTQGMPYDDAVNQVKRKFLSGAYGEQFKDLEIWAPFIHYGL